MLKLGMWNKTHYLNKMTLGELVVAYFQYYAIQAYLVLAAVTGYFAFQHVTVWWKAAIAAGFSVFAYPLIWYLLHRYVLHSQWMYKSPLTARVWKRIHYDHHQDPHHLEILFGALYTTLPTIVLATGPIGWAIDGLGGALTAICAGLLMTCVYEFCHCIQHLSYKPKNRYLQIIKQRHMEHHFQDEDGNFGITNFFWDKLFGTFYERGERPVKSETVFNLGYTPVQAERYPWVARASGGKVHMGTPRDKRKAAANDDLNNAA